MMTTTSKGLVVEIRPPVMTDVPAMRDFINTLSAEDIYLNANPKYLYSLADEEAYVKSCVERMARREQVYLLALVDGKLVGSVTLTKQALRRVHVGVLGITIGKDHRGKGLGRLLMREAIGKAARIGVVLITLSAFADNEPALALYRSLGFEEYGRLERGFSYKEGFRDEVLMQLWVGDHATE